MIALASNGPRERTEHIFSAADRTEDVSEVISRQPVELRQRPTFNVHPIYSGQHAPATLPVQLLTVGKQRVHHSRRVRAQLSEVLGRERSRGADDVAAKPDVPQPPGGQDVRVNRISEINPSMQVLVHLEI